MSNPQRQNNNSNGRKRKRQGGQNGKPNKKRRANQGANQPGFSNVLVQAPQSAQRMRVNPPKARQGMTKNGNRTVIFEEYVEDVISSATTLAFSAKKYAIQPGVSQLFAWLADQAVNYQKYKFKKIAFRFETDQQTGIAGKVMMAFTPDAADGVPVSKQEMLEYGIKGKAPVWGEFRMPIPLELQKEFFIRSGTLANNLDIKTYDFGALFVGTSGIVTASNNVGELYVEYTLELIEPVVQSLGQAQARSVTLTGTTGIAIGTPFGTAPTVLGGLDVAADATGAALQFNRVGNYIVEMELTGTVLNTAFAPTGVVGNAVGATTPAFGSVTQIPGISNAAANAGTVARVAFAVVVLQRGAFFTPTLTPQGTSVTASITRIATYSIV